MRCRTGMERGLEADREALEMDGAAGAVVPAGVVLGAGQAGVEVAARDAETNQPHKDI